MHERLPKGHLRKRGTIWWCQWKRHGKAYSVSLKTKAERDAHLLFRRHMDVVRASILNGSHEVMFDSEVEDAITSESEKDIHLSEAWARFLRSVARPDTGESTMGQYAYQFGVFVDWVHKHHSEVTTIGSVSKTVARAFATDLATTLAPGTFNKYLDLLRRVFAILLDEINVKDCPWAGIQKKKGTGSGRRSFTKTEIAKIFSVIDMMAAGTVSVRKADGTEITRKLNADAIAVAMEMRTLCMLAYHTGLRLGDCSTLLWTEIDLFNNEIVRVPLKTRRRHPDKAVVIPLNPELRDYLANLPRSEGTPLVCPLSAAKYWRNYGKGRSESSDDFMYVLELAGIRAHKNGTGVGTEKRAIVEVGFHSFRHTWVTISAESGVDDASIRAIVGWGSPAMAKIYTHIGRDHLREEMAKRPSLAESTSATAVAFASPPAKDQAISLDGMAKADLERLLAAVTQKLTSKDT